MCGKLVLTYGMADGPWTPKQRDHGPIQGALALWL